MNENTKRNIIICIIIVFLFFLANSYTTTLFSANKYNKYTTNDIKFKDPKEVVKNFVTLMIDNNFEDAYKLLNEKTKTIFKSSDELKEYFVSNYITVNKNENGVLIVDKYSKVNDGYNTYTYIVVSEKYKAPKDYDPFYSESEFNIFNSITLYEKSPVDYNIEINI